MSAEDISKLLESVCKQSQVSSNLSSYLPPSMQPPLAAGSVQQDSNGVCVKLVAYLTGSSHDPQLEARVAETFASLAREGQPTFIGSLCSNGVLCLQRGFAMWLSNVEQCPH